MPIGHIGYRTICLLGIVLCLPDIMPIGHYAFWAYCLPDIMPTGHCVMPSGHYVCWTLSLLIIMPTIMPMPSVMRRYAYRALCLLDIVLCLPHIMLCLPDVMLCRPAFVPSERCTHRTLFVLDTVPFGYYAYQTFYFILFKFIYIHQNLYK